MRKKLEKYANNESIQLPVLNISFCFNRAVITIKRPHDDHPRRHYEVFFGLLFWLRMIIGIIIVYYKEIKKMGLGE